jgi:CDP-paratose 2-epimerase
MTGRVLITGGAGFIGCNLAAHLARSGRRVCVFDDLSRDGVDRNLAWLQRTYGAKVDACIADVRDRAKLRAAIADADAVFHFAAQVAVATSLVEPSHDFDVNARGTLEVLEAVRRCDTPPPVVFASTSRVYGGLAELALHDDGSRWQPVDPQITERGIDEAWRLDLRTPYGCSKGCADQYVLDYARSFGIPAIVLRTSCVYGPRQLASDDDDWVAHYLARALDDKPLAVYGDGKQVRDLLFVDDLVDALIRAWSRIGSLSGRAFNVGGGPATALSLRELIALVEVQCGQRPEIRYQPWRPGDQRYYVSNASAFTAATGWQPRVTPRAGIETVHGTLTGKRAPVPLEAARHA